VLRAVQAVLVVSVVATGLASCSTGPATERTGAILWRPCGSIQCATLSVPLDRTHPAGRRIHLALARHPANGKRLGVLMANPGGPGGSGVELVRDAENVFSHKVLDQFDIVSWDPRGSGASTTVDCTDKLDFFYEINRSSADPATARTNAEAAKRFADSCRRNGRGVLPFLSTRASAADMDAIRAAMGVRTISYLGFSYGTYLGALYAERYPHRVRAMVLDGAIDPSLSSAAGTIRQAEGFDRALRAFLRWCTDNSKCNFARHGNPVTAFHDLTTSLNHETLPAAVGGEPRTLGPGEANIGIATALYAGRGRDGWERLGTALRQVSQGNGSGLVALSDLYTGRKPGGTYDETTDAFYAIGCLDAPSPPTVAAVRQVAERAERVAPVFGASNAWLGLPCTFWPAPPDGKPGPIHAAGAPPILVLGTTDDPATPYRSAQALSRELQSGHLLTYVGEGHTAYGRHDECIDDKVDDYLVSLHLPRAGTRCK
jgi:pimeloyl-ACP methyl ester carboxylesterase